MEEKIIQFMKKNRFLYDKREEYYKDMYLRDVKFRELANALNVPVKRIKERWRTLKDKYLREMKFSKRRSGSDSLKQQKEWKWMEHLRFLSDIHEIDHFRVPRGKKAREQRRGHLRDVAITDAGKPSPAGPFPIALFSIASPPKEAYSTTELSLEAATSSLSSAPAPPATSAPKKDTVERQLTEVLEFMKEIKDISHKKKPASRLFFENLAQQLEEAQLPPPRVAILQAELLATFNRIVYDV